MTLSERLELIHSVFSAKAQREELIVMHCSSVDLRNSGILDKVPLRGDSLPSFELPDTDGTPVRSADHLARGPLVVTFYRGVW